MAECLECGKSFKRRQYNASFCGGVCRRTWNNRRQVRGALVYDFEALIMNTVQGEKRGKLEARLGLLLASYAEEDKKAGRRTYQTCSAVMTATATLESVRIA